MRGGTILAATDWWARALGTGGFASLAWQVWSWKRTNREKLKIRSTVSSVGRAEGGHNAYLEVENRGDLPVKVTGIDRQLQQHKVMTSGWRKYFPRRPFVGSEPDLKWTLEHGDDPIVTRGRAVINVEDPGNSMLMNPSVGYRWRYVVITDRGRYSGQTHSHRIR